MRPRGDASSAAKQCCNLRLGFFVAFISPAHTGEGIMQQHSRWDGQYRVLTGNRRWE